MDVHEWFETLDHSDGDADFIRMLLHNLKGYSGTPPLKDMLEVINFVTAVRLHQLRNTRLPSRDEIVNSNTLEMQIMARELMKPEPEENA